MTRIAPPHRTLFMGARWVWLLLVVISVAAFVFGLLASLWALGAFSAGLLETGAAGESVALLGISTSTFAVLRIIQEAILFAINFLIAALVFRRRLEGWFDLLMAFFFLAFGVTLGQDVIGFGLRLILSGDPAFVGELLNDPGWILFFVFVFLFPDGRFVPRWTRWALLALILIFSLDYLILDPPPWTLYISMLLLVVGMAAQIYRYRRVSTPQQQRQTKWVVYGLVLFILASVILFGSGINPALQDVLLYVILPVLPVTIGIAILRGQLWDIDVIIRRTLVYTALTLTLALVYFGSVILLQGLLEAVSARSVGSLRSPVSVVISTLVIAALFNPLRKRIQSDIDRRFFRQKYDAEKVVAAFAASLREEVDLDDLQAQIVAVVQETLQPEQVSLWMKPRDR